MIDIGINLASESFHHDRNQVISDAKAAGLTWLIVTGSSLESNRLSQEIVAQNPDFMRATAGIHPHHAHDVSPEDLDTISEQLKAPYVVAAGEAGLDYFRNLASPKDQKKVFEQVLEIAIGQHKPIFLHQRDAHHDFYPILKSYRDQLVQGVVHCFTDQKRALFDYLDLDLHIGLTGWVADERRGTHLLPLVKDIPWNRLMIETDGPYLLPRNIKPAPKSRRNEPKYLPYVAEKIAECRSTTPEEVIRHTTATAQAFFDLPL